MDCSTPGSPVLHYLLKFAQIHVMEAVILSNHLILCCRLLLPPSFFQASGSFPMSQFFPSGGQSIGVSAYIQDRFPLGLTGLISLKSKGLSRVFSINTVQKHQFSPTPQFKSTDSSVLSFLYSPAFTSTHDYWKNHSFD